MMLGCKIRVRSGKTGGLSLIVPLLYELLEMEEGLQGGQGKPHFGVGERTSLR